MDKKIINVYAPCNGP